MDRIINILLLIIIFVFDPLAISLVVAANFAFDQANKKNLYNEYEDELYDDDPWGNEEESEDIEVKSEQVLPDEARGATPPDWKVVDENDQELKDKKVETVLQKTPTKRRIKFTDGSTQWVNKKDFDQDTNTIRYL